MNGTVDQLKAAVWLDDMRRRNNDTVLNACLDDYAYTLVTAWLAFIDRALRDGADKVLLDSDLIGEGMQVDAFAGLDFPEELNDEVYVRSVFKRFGESFGEGDVNLPLGYVMKQIDGGYEVSKI